MNKYIRLRKTDKYIEVTSFLIGGLIVYNWDFAPIYLKIDSSNSRLGAVAREALEASYTIDYKIVVNMVKDIKYIESSQQKHKNKEKELIVNYGYKSRKALYENMLDISVAEIGEQLELTPTHQHKLGEFHGIDNVDSIFVDACIDNENLGKAIRETFNLCTSIYQK